MTLWIKRLSLFIRASTVGSLSYVSLQSSKSLRTQVSTWVLSNLGNKAVCIYLTRKKSIYTTRIRISVPPFHRVYERLRFFCFFVFKRKKRRSNFFEGFYPPRGGSIRGFFAVGSEDGLIAAGRVRSRLGDKSIGPSVHRSVGPSVSHTYEYWTIRPF